MDDDLRALRIAVRTWYDSYDHGSDGIAFTDFVLKDRYDEQPWTSVPLPDSLVTDLAYLLSIDAAARTGSGPVDRGVYSADEAADLRYAATRVEQLLNAGDQFPGGVDASSPNAATTLLAEAARAAEALAELVTSVTDSVADSLRKGALVALSAPAAVDGVLDQAEEAAAREREAAAISNALAAAARQILDLAAALGALQRTSSSAVLGARPTDGPTLADEAVLDCRLPGMANTCRFHIRVFRPVDTKPVIVIGDMADNNSTSITNSVEEVAATVAELILDGAAHDAVTWVQLYPAGRHNDNPAGLIDVVEFKEPYNKPKWRPIPQDELEKLVAGHVRTWHAADYNLTTMTRRSIRILRPATQRRRPRAIRSRS